MIFSPLSLQKRIDFALHNEMQFMHNKPLKTMAYMQEQLAKFWRNGFFKQIFGCSLLCVMHCKGSEAGLFKSS